MQLGIDTNTSVECLVPWSNRASFIHFLKNESTPSGGIENINHKVIVAEDDGGIVGIKFSFEGVGHPESSTASDFVKDLTQSSSTVDEASTKFQIGQKQGPAATTTVASSQDQDNLPRDTSDIDTKKEKIDDTITGHNHNNKQVVSIATTIPTDNADNKGSKIQVKYTITYIDHKTLSSTKQEHILELDYKKKFRVNVFLNRGILCLVWVHHNQCTALNFNANSPASSKFSTPYLATKLASSFTCHSEDQSASCYKGDTNNQQQYPIVMHFRTDEKLKDAFFMTLDNNFLVVSSQDEDFLDSVFSSDDASLRMTSYYSCVDTEVRFHSKEVIGQILELDPLIHVSDILFLDDPSNPRWMVLEWALPQMTLNQINVYCVENDSVNNVEITCGVDDIASHCYIGNTYSANKDSVKYSAICSTAKTKIKRDGVINFRNDFTVSEYASFFGKIHQLQKVVLTRDPWRAFVWVSLNYVIIVDLQEYDVIGILHTADLSRFRDSWNEHHDFQLSVARVEADLYRVTLFVTMNRDIVHFCRFIVSCGRN